MPDGVVVPEAPEVLDGFDVEDAVQTVTHVQDSGGASHIDDAVGVVVGQLVERASVQGMKFAADAEPACKQTANRARRVGLFSFRTY